MYIYIYLNIERKVQAVSESRTVTIGFFLHKSKRTLQPLGVTPATPEFLGRPVSLLNLSHQPLVLQTNQIQY